MANDTERIPIANADPFSIEDLLPGRTAAEQKDPQEKPPLDALSSFPPDRLLAAFLSG